MAEELSPEQMSILAAIGSTEPSTFAEFCSGLKNCPARQDTAGWRALFEHLEYLERSGLIRIERQERRIGSLILTDAGADRIRGKLDEARGLFASL